MRKTGRLRHATMFAPLIALTLFLSGSLTPVAAQRKDTPPSNAVIGSMIDSSPLRIVVADNLAMAVYHNGAAQFYGENAAGTFVAINGVMYGSDPAASIFFNPLPFNSVSNSAATGTGTAADPFTIVTVVAAGDTGVQVTQTTTYVNGDSHYGIGLAVTNTGTVQRSIRIFYGADLYLNFPGNEADYGYGFYDRTTGAIGARSQDYLNVQAFIPITRPNAYQESTFTTFWTNLGIEGNPNLNNTIDTTYHDVAAGLQWNRSLAAGATETISMQGGFGRTTDVGVSPRSSLPSPHYAPATVHAVFRTNPNSTVARNSTVVCTIVITNRGTGSASDATITLPFDPAIVRVIDASFSRPTVWVSQLVTNSLAIRTNRLANDGDVVTATIRLSVLANAPEGAIVSDALSVKWQDDVNGGQARSNGSVLVVGAADSTVPTYSLAVSPSSGASGTSFIFKGSIFAPGEPVGVWYNAPNGTVVGGSTFYAKADGSLTVSFADKVTPGAYAMVFYGHWTKFTAVGAFEVQ